jgi:hypothetical protein
MWKETVKLVGIIRNDDDGGEDGGQEAIVATAELVHRGTDGNVNVYHLPRRIQIDYHLIFD